MERDDFYLVALFILMAVASPVLGVAQNSGGVIIDTTVCGQFEWHDSTYTLSDTLVFNSLDPAIGDTTIYLTVYQNIETSWEHTACESYTWLDSTYTESGDYTRTFTNVNGCDSIVTLHLTVNYGTHTSVMVNACDSFTYHGVTYTSSYYYTPLVFHDTNDFGCVNTDTLRINLAHSFSRVRYDTACVAYLNWQEYDWETGEYIYLEYPGLTTSGMYTTIIPGYEWMTPDSACPLRDTLYLTMLGTFEPMDIIGVINTDGTYEMLYYPDNSFNFYHWWKNSQRIEGAQKYYYDPREYDFEEYLDTSACYSVEMFGQSGGDWDDCYSHSAGCWKPSMVQSINSTAQFAKVRILPNPNSGHFRLLLPEGTANVQILDANGQLVLSRKTDGSTELEMDTCLANGLYFVKTYRQDGSFNTEKLIINR